MRELSNGHPADGKGSTRKRRVTRRPGRDRRKNKNREVQQAGIDTNAAVTTDAGVGLNGNPSFRTNDPGSEPVNRSPKGHGRKRHRHNRSDSQSSRSLQDNRDAQSSGDRPPKRTNRNGGAKNSNSPGKIYAALDLGTNNCRLLMAVPRHGGRFRVIDGFSRIVRLGEGLSATGRLSSDAMDRAVEALGVCAEKLGARTVKRMRLIATEACRQAENGQEFLDRVRDETGLELEVVTRETEARLAAEGCGILMDRDSDGAVMFDIGGGSTELILVRGRRKGSRRISERIDAWTSLPLGVVTLAEQFGGKEVTHQVFDDMKGFVVEAIGDFAETAKANGFLPEQDFHLLGTSGTVTTVAGLHLGLLRYERRKVDGLWLTSGEIDEVIEDLMAMDYEQRKGNPCIGAERADLVLAGCAILEAIRDTWPADRLRVADRGLREGLLTEMMGRDRVWQRQVNHRRQKRNRSAQSNSQQTGASQS